MMRLTFVAAIVCSFAPIQDNRGSSGQEENPAATEKKPGSPSAPKYQEYGNYDLREALQRRTTADGKDEPFVEMKLVLRVVDDLASHAMNYPPQFHSELEKLRAKRDAEFLATIFDTIAAHDDADPELLLLAGQVSAIGHNLDIRGAAQKAHNYFQRLLKRESNHPRGNFFYGVFLGQTANRQKEAIPYLEKALKLGVTDAGFSLGVAYLMLGDQAKSLEYLEAYSKKNPGDSNVKAIIDAIKSGRIKIEKRTN